MQASGITVINVGGSANGGNLAYSDLLAILETIVNLKQAPPYAWFLNGRTLLRILSLQDGQSRPLFLWGPNEFAGPAVGSILGWPAYVTTSIATNESVGSGASQSHLILANPRSIHIAESGDISLDVSQDFALDAGQVALRISHLVDFGYQPAASVCVLAGIN